MSGDVMTYSEKLLLLVAYSIEVPYQLCKRLFKDDNYYNRLVNRLVSENYFRDYFLGTSRHLRISTKGKKKLRNSRNTGYEFFLGVKVRTSMDERSRQFHIADVLITMLNTNVLIERDKKINLFNENADKSGFCEHFNNPVFYLPREVQEFIKKEDKPINGSRFTGVLLHKNKALITYNIGDGERQFVLGTERKLLTKLESYFSSLTPLEKISTNTIIFGKEDDSFKKMFEKCNSNFLTSFTNDIFYFPLNSQGDIGFSLLNSELKQFTDEKILSKYKEKEEQYFIDCDGIDENKRPVLVSYIFNLPRLYRFINVLRINNARGVIVCFEYQVELLKEYTGDFVTFNTISLSHFESNLENPKTN